jgi:hypothetical protein
MAYNSYIFLTCLLCFQEVLLSDGVDLSEENRSKSMERSELGFKSLYIKVESVDLKFNLSRCVLLMIWISDAVKYVVLKNIRGRAAHVRVEFKHSLNHFNEEDRLLFENLGYTHSLLDVRLDCGDVLCCLFLLYES